MRGTEEFSTIVLLNPSTATTALLLAVWSFLTALTAQAAGPFTKVSIVDGRWHINGEVTYRGAKAEGLLLNARMVNATFEDAKRPD